MGEWNQIPVELSDSISISIDFRLIYPLALSIVGNDKPSHLDYRTTIMTKKFDLEPMNFDHYQHMNFSLFFLKTHKTGSSSISSILWKSLCTYHPKKNCFLPPKENPGRTWNKKDRKYLLEKSKGTEVWNSHIKLNPVSFFMTNEFPNTSSNFAKEEIEFSTLFFTEILSKPSHFLSILRRPSYRFESAFHWYELSSYLPTNRIEDNYATKLLNLLSNSVMGKAIGKQKKNRLNKKKLKSYSGGANDLQSALLFKQFVQDIARKIVNKVESSNLSIPLDYSTREL
jgi:hypothetical protein